MARMTLDVAHPLAHDSALPFALPDFAALTPEHYPPAFEAGMAEALAELDAVAADPAPATAENVLDAWEASGRLLDRALTAFFVTKAVDTNDRLDAIEAEFAPKLARHSDAIFLNRAYYDRLRALADRAASGEVELDAEQRWLLDDLLAAFVRNGVALEPADQERLRGLNTRLAELGTRFEQANLAARNAGALTVTDEAELAGLSAEEVAALRQADGTFRIELVNTSQQPILTRLTRRDVRRRIFEASVTRGLGAESKGAAEPADTRDIIAELARLRAERALLLGYPHHAALVVERQCAKTTDAVAAMLGRLAPAALAQARREAEELRARFAELYPGEEFAPWDWAFVADAIRRERFDLDPAVLAPHLTVDRVLAAVHGAATRLYGLTFARRPDLRGHTADAEVYEVREADGTPIGLFVMDFWARPTKQGGAWMNSVVRQSGLLGHSPVVTNNCNFAPGASTITWDGVITMFHEFGHALHGLLASSRYPSKSGTATPRDFVELPSQVNEHWAWEPDAVIPAELAERMLAAEAFGQGFHNYETWSAMLLDQAWHTTPPAELPASGADVEEFERRALASAGVAYDLIPPRYRSQYFQHIWGHGYAAAYYSYVWAEVMDADAVAWFDERGGATRANGDHFRRTILAPGGSVDAMESWRAFRGRDPEIGPLLARKGIDAGQRRSTGSNSTSSVGV